MELQEAIKRFEAARRVLGHRVMLGDAVVDALPTTSIREALVAYAGAIERAVLDEGARKRGARVVTPTVVILPAELRYESHSGQTRIVLSFSWGLPWLRLYRSGIRLNPVLSVRDAQLILAVGRDAVASGEVVDWTDWPGGAEGFWALAESPNTPWWVASALPPRMDEKWERKMHHFRYGDRPDGTVAVRIPASRRIHAGGVGIMPSGRPLERSVRLGRSVRTQSRSPFAWREMILRSLAREERIRRAP